MTTEKTFLRLREDFARLTAPTTELQLGEVSVLVRGLTGREREAYETLMMTARETKQVPENWRVHLILPCIVDESLQSIFTAADLEYLVSLPHIYIEQLVDAVCKLSGIELTAKEAAKEEFKKKQ